MTDLVALHRARASAVIGIDFGPGSMPSLRHALRMLDYGLTAELHVLHAVSKEIASCEPELLPEIPATLGRIARGCLPWSVAGAWAHVRIGAPMQAIRDLAFDVGASLVIVGRSRAAGLDCYAPFSVLIAGSSLELIARNYAPTRCEACRIHRSRPASPSPFCAEHIDRSGHATAIGLRNSLH